MAGPLVASVEVLCIPGELFTHDRRYPVFAALKQKMRIIGHKDPCIDFAVSLYDIFRETFEEKCLVLIVFKDRGFIYSTYYDVV